MGSKRFSKLLTSSSLLRNRNFLAIWLGQGGSSLGDYIYNVTLLLFVYELTGSAFEVGKVLAFQVIPTIFLGPVAGIYVDRWPRKQVMIAADIGRGLLIALMPWVSQIYQVYIITFLTSAISIFFGPALSASMPNIVRKEDLLRANGLMATTRRIAQIVGPSLGGVLVAWQGVAIGFYLNALSFFLSAMAIALISLPSTVTQQVGRIKFHQDLLAGLSYIRHSPAVLLLVALTLLVGLGIGANNALVVAFAKEVLQIEAARFGLLMSALGIGTLLGAMLTTALGKRIPRADLLQASLLLGGLSYLVFASVPFLFVSILMRTGLGIGMMAYRISSGTTLQELVPDAFRGRVFATAHTLEDAAATLAMAAAGFLADVIGVQAAFLSSGGSLVAAGLLAFLFLKRSLIQQSSLQAKQEVGQE